MFESALEAGFVAAGVDVNLIGPLPTPGVAYMTQRFDCDFGVVISASHNLYEDNGIKFFDRSGGKLSDALERQIEARLDEPAATVPDVTGLSQQQATQKLQAAGFQVTVNPNTQQQAGAQPGTVVSQSPAGNSAADHTPCSCAFQKFSPRYACSHSTPVSPPSRRSTMHWTVSRA